MIQILYFVDKWLNKFLDETTNYIELVDHYMADECKALGFEMDSGASFTEKYGHQAGNIDVFCHIIDQVTDISILGNAIYSSWRYFNHWAYSAKEILYPENRQWFIVALIRLGELAIRQHRYLLGESHIEHHSVVNKSKGQKNRKIQTHSQSDKIVNWLINRAADYGLTSALYLLGEIYEYGISVEKNLHIAFTYYHQAAQRQHKDAYLKVAQGFKCGRGVSADEKEAIYWYKQAAMIGNAEAQFWYGIAIETGIGLPSSPKDALKWYLLAAEQNHAGAQYNAAICYHYGRGTDVDLDKALHYYRLSAEGGDSMAQFNLAVCCENGIGMSSNKTEALFWYTKSAESGYVKAQVCLAHCYQHGQGVSADTDVAKYWYNKAAEQGDQLAVEALKTL